VQNTLGEIGAKYEVIDSAAPIAKATKIILPGVGHFGQMMRSLDAMKVREPLLAAIRSGTPFLGICLGLQALFTDSEEAPGLAGFGLFPGTVRRFQGDMRIPHMGWNELCWRKPPRLIKGLPENPHVYFANSYYCPIVEATAAECHYGIPFTAVLEQDNVFGVQFHPEKSGPVGLQIVRNFVEL
jgi:imidazole glycerol phosphate synthase glutamine amidotransferase subunit